MSRRTVAATLAASVLLLLGVVCALVLSGARTSDQGRVQQDTPAPSVLSPVEQLRVARDDCNVARFADCEGVDLRLLAQQDPVQAVERYHALAAENPRLRETCHSLFHDIGFGAVDGDRTLWEAFMVGSSECNWGYIHGAMERALDTDLATIVETAAALCTIPDQLDPTDAFVASAAGNCIHGTGHALFRATYDPLTAERGCRDAFTDGDDARNCIDGMIMEVGNSESADAAKFVDLCTDIGADVRETCYANIALTWLRNDNYDFDTAYSRCQAAEPSQVLLEKCGAGISGIQTFSESFEFAVLTKVCEDQVQHVRTGCYIGVAQSATQGMFAGAITSAEFDAFVTAVPSDVRSRVDETVENSLAGLGDASPGSDLAAERD